MRKMIMAIIKQRETNLLDKNKDKNCIIVYILQYLIIFHKLQVTVVHLHSRYGSYAY